MFSNDCCKEEIKLMSKRENVSMSVIRRLPRYYRFLRQLQKEGATRISSTELSKRLGLTASQIRQDLNCFGGFGQQGYGYMVDQLCSEIRQILGLDHCYKAVLFGAGNLGRAIASHMSFEAMGFQLIGIFDNDPLKTGKIADGLPIRMTETFESFYQKEHPDVAVLCIPRGSAQKNVDYLYKVGIRNFWNFSHYDIAMRYPDVVVENVHLNDSLMTLCYRMSN
jgi:redox-sensing transcriptional repressor